MNVMEEKRRIDYFLLFNIFMPLIIGGIGYYFLYPSSYLARVTDRFMGVSAHASLQGNTIIGILRNYLFDMLWVYSLLFALTVVIGRKNLIFNTACSVASGVIFELFQLWEIVPGTFDVVDICVEICGGLIGWFIICSRYGGKNYEED